MRSKMLESCQQRARMPPPGFNPMNTFGGLNAGSRANAQPSSKILPFMNGNSQQQQQHPNSINHSWNHQLQQQQSQHGYDQLNNHPQQQMQGMQGMQSNKSGTLWLVFCCVLVSVCV